MTLPTILPPKYNGTYKDFLQTKVSRDGAGNTEVSVTSVPSGTTATTIVGLIPFNRGMRIAPRAMSVMNDALGAGATASLGYIYNDNVTYTNNQTAFLALTTVATAGVLQPIGLASDWVAAADGWLVATFGGTTTATTGNLTANVSFVYDGVNTAN